MTAAAWRLRPCYHVAMSNGDVFGVSAGSGAEARDLANQRITLHDYPFHIVRTTYVGRWEAELGTVLYY
jgi:hypothetical protein